jgi:hypothetical protein
MAEKRETTKKYEYFYEMRRDYPVGCRVRMSPFGRKTWPISADKKGKIVGYSRTNFSVHILWDGRKTTTNFHVDYIERIP